MVKVVNDLYVLVVKRLISATGLDRIIRYGLIAKLKIDFRKVMCIFFVRLANSISESVLNII